MNDLTGAIREMTDMDELSQQSSPVHRLHPMVKLILAVVYIFLVVSFSKENLTGLVPMVLFPILVFSVSGIPVRVCFYKLRIILPLVCAVGIWNPILDRRAVLTIGALTVSSGMLTFITLMLKGVFSLMASFLLIATTGIESICYALGLLHIPKVMVTLVLITYRYISLLMNEAGNMLHAYSLRAPGQNGIHYSAWGSFLGQLLIRSMDRANELYQSMILRGFNGSFYYARNRSIRLTDLIVLVLSLICLAGFRLVNVSDMLGRLFI